jgi:hypothetical protein
MTNTLRSGSVQHRMHVDGQGFSPCPGGFFPESGILPVTFSRQFPART